MALTRRVEVLFEPDQYRELERISRSKRESVADLVRKAVEQQYLRPTLEQRQAAVKRLLSQQFDLGDWEDVKREMEEDLYKHIIKSVDESVLP